jgi:hypothetical protein
MFDQSDHCPGLHPSIVPAWNGFVINNKFFGVSYSLYLELMVSYEGIPE